MKRVAIGIFIGMVWATFAVVPMDRAFRPAKVVTEVREVEVVRDIPVVPDSEVLVDINAMIDVGFTLVDPEGYIVSHFDEATDNDGSYRRRR